LTRIVFGNQAGRHQDAVSVDQLIPVLILFLENKMSDMPPDQLAALIEIAEADAQASIAMSTSPGFTRSFRSEAKRVGSMWVTMIPGLDSAFFNRILCLGVGEPATESMLDEAIAVLHDAGCQNYMAQVSPYALPAEIPEWLVKRGINPSRNWAKMYRENQAAPLIPSDLRVEKIGADQADAFADVVLPAFEMPPALRPLVKGAVGQSGWLHYLAYDGNKPVSAAAMHVKGEVAWLGFASTQKKYRRRGAQGAMFARRIQDGLVLGCKWFVTETGEDTPENPNPSYHNMLRSGFQLAYQRRNYFHKAPANILRIVHRALRVAIYGLKIDRERKRMH
jgi:hypothetical protein